MLERDLATKYDPATVDGLRLHPKTEVGRKIAAQVSFLETVFGNRDSATKSALRYTPNAKLAALRNPDTGEVVTFPDRESLDESLACLGDDIDFELVQRLQVFVMQDDQI